MEGGLWLWATQQSRKPTVVLPCGVYTPVAEMDSRQLNLVYDVGV